MNDILFTHNTRPIMDVRAPGEYTQGHIPGAINIPLLSDEQRALVGTIYAQKGKERAIETGFDILGKYVPELVEQVRRETNSKELLIHCWRGGMRSKSVAWVLELFGYNTQTLEGGYKAFRRHVSSVFERPHKLIILGGSTGIGKTRILQALHILGEQVIDLEELANHRGSAFGGLGKGAQPTQAQFENELAWALMHADPARPIWLEDESIKIGSRIILPSFFAQMRAAPIIYAEHTRVYRLETIVREYGIYSPQEIQACVMIIKEHLGGELTKRVLKAVDIPTQFSMLLEYYDKKYEHGKKLRTSPTLQVVLTGSDPLAHARQILEHVYKSKTSQGLDRATALCTPK